MRNLYSLEPLSLGEIIDRTLLVFKESWKDFLIPAAIYAVPMQIVFIISFIEGFLGRKSNEPVMVLLNIITSGLSWALFIFLSGCVIEMTRSIVENKPIGWKQALKNFLSIFWKYVWTTILYIFAFGGIIAIISLIVVPLFFAAMAGKMWGILIFAIVAVLAFGVMTYLVSSLLLVPNVAIIENVFGVNCLKRSSELFNTGWDARWKIMLLPGMMQLLIFVFSIFIPFLNYLIMLMLAPLPIIALTLVYYDIRIRAEGLDIEMRIAREEVE